MKEMNKTERFTDKEWEELASLLSEEKCENKELLDRFMSEDIQNAGQDWKELKTMNSKKEINVEKAWNNVYSRLGKIELPSDKVTGKTISMRSIMIRVAAVALILIGLGSATLYLNNSGAFSKKITVITASDKKNLLVSLSDGSKIYLNRNTKLTYHANFGKQKRDVKLTGEAFFEIAPDVSKPFIIDAGNAKVKVVGTSFNVITQNDKSAVEVFVKTGKVMLSDNSGSKSLVLDPGFVGKMNSEISEKTVNNDPNYLSWNSGLLVYSGQKLEVVFKDLKRVYDMDIIADDPDILVYPWTSPIDNSSQDKIILLICTSFNLSYIKDGNVYHLSKK